MTNSTTTSRKGGQPAPLVLLLSNSADSHVPPVEAELDQLGIHHVRLDTDLAWPHIAVETVVDADGHRCRLHTGGHTVDLGEVAAIWNRRPATPAVPDWLTDESRQFAVEETAVALHGALRSLDCAWLNHPDTVRAASFKPAQLRVAAECGFRVPRTYIGQDPETIRRFVTDLGGSAIVKLVSPGPPRLTSDDPYNVFAQLVTRADLDSDETLAASPAIWQEPIDKAHELRVTLVGDQLLACAIDSQAAEDSQTDWRRADPAQIRHRPVDLDQDTERICLAFADRYRLSFAAFDLIVTATGEVVFVECNPNGQWLWVQDHAGLPIASAIARWLARA